MRLGYASPFGERCMALGRRVGLNASRTFFVPWDRIEGALGTTLPSSYKVFIEYFGPGRFGEEFEYLTPGIENGVYELVHAVHQERESATRVSNQSTALPWTAPPIYPDPSGLLIFATLPEDSLYWRTGPKDPDSWQIVIPSKGGFSLVYEGDIIGFVDDLLNESPEIGDIQYDPDLARDFVPNDGRHSGRGPRLEAISYFLG